MKHFKNTFSAIIVIMLASMSFTNAAHAQDLDQVTIQTMINSKSFVFKAQTALPSGIAARQLTPDYDVRLWSDSVISYLPYFGRSYSASFGVEGGIKFTSTDFDYKVKQRKKGGWEINLIPKDTREVRELNFTISENGNAYLQVTSNSRQSISFYGYIAERK